MEEEVQSKVSYFLPRERISICWNLLIFRQNSIFNLNFSFYVTCIFPILSPNLYSFVRSWWVWRYYRKFFPIELIKTAELNPEKSYLLGSHPHGLLCSGAFCSFATDAAGFKDKFPGLDPRLLTLKGQFVIPGYRELILSTGACAATKEGMEALLK